MPGVCRALTLLGVNVQYLGEPSAMVRVVVRYEDDAQRANETRRNAAAKTAAQLRVATFSGIKQHPAAKTPSAYATVCIATAATTTIAAAAAASTIITTTNTTTIATGAPRVTEPRLHEHCGTPTEL